MGSTQSTPYRVIGGVTTTQTLPSYTTTFYAAATPSPPVLSCGVKGTLSKPSILDDFFVDKDDIWNKVNYTQFDYCQSNCLPTDVWCSSFAFDSTSKNCTIYNETLSAMGLQITQDPKDTKLLYNKHCFENVTKVAHPVETLYLYRPPAETGILTNPDVTYDSQLHHYGWRVSWFWTVELPFEMEFYGVKTNSVNVSKNGMLGLDGTGNYMQSYHNPLPAWNIAENTTIFPYWADISAVAHTNQSIRYTILGEAPNRNVTFSWAMTDRPTHTQSFIFSVFYSEANPGTVSMHYDRISNGALDATIGAQTTHGGRKFSQYLYNNVTRNATLPNRITDGAILDWDKEKEEFVLRQASAERVQPSPPAVYTALQ